MGSVARCGVEGGRYVLLAASRLTDRAYAAGDSPAGATPLDDSPCPPGHNTPLPLERSPPVSFKRLLGSSIAYEGLSPGGSARSPAAGRARPPWFSAQPRRARGNRVVLAWHRVRHEVPGLPDQAAEQREAGVRAV